ncbi:hypothetical protein KMZ32_06830 [Phycicoccus sp. MAQZ13P-2]|uniref:hypothetical protein n=1 Tax=Phycicoccus mangrovi TaxID=2840470 RepID=UPI001C002963|nr:hypothetical protein [Phycicoccus mangrovi]MBT9256200.1 hypothetical protein [Phycicoccus mangrovi]MBT9273785.1 hypothetical protein [Phycicoccus mangrovi]
MSAALARSSPPRAGTRSLPPRAVSAAAAVIGLALLYLVEVRPGWRTLTLLTPAAEQLVPWVVGALWTGVVLETVALVVRTRWWRAVADLTSSAVGLAAAVAAWDLFPVAVSGPGRVLLRAVLVVAIVGGVAGVVSSLVRILGGSPPDPDARRRRRR